MTIPIHRDTDARACGATTTVAGNFIIGNDLTVNGTNTILNTTTITADDPLIRIADNNTANTSDIGFYGKYVNSMGRVLFVNDVMKYI